MKFRDAEKSDERACSSRRDDIYGIATSDDRRRTKTKATGGCRAGQVPQTRVPAHVMKDSRKKRIPQEPYYVPLSSSFRERTPKREKKKAGPKEIFFRSREKRVVVLSFPGNGRSLLIWSESTEADKADCRIVETRNTAQKNNDSFYTSLENKTRQKAL